MARAFGDFCLKDFGLISVPEITYRHLTENDEFVVLATDGVTRILIQDFKCHSVRVLISNGSLQYFADMGCPFK